MIITDIQLVNALGCCPCLFPECDEPQTECQSITLDACGFAVPVHPDVPADVACLLYRYRYETRDETRIEITDDGTETETINEHSFWDTKSRSEYVLGVCDGAIVSQSYSNRDEYKLRDNATGDLLTGEIYTDNTSSVDGAICQGSYTYTDLVDPAGNDSGPSSGGCEIVSWSPDATWTYAALVFTDHYSPAANTAGIATVEFSQPITPEDVLADLNQAIADLAGADWPGTSCNAPSLFSSGDCEQVTSATKVRYKVGIPDGYARSRWEMQWDIGFFPKEFEDWLDAGQVGPQPTVAPSIVKSESWTWDGTPANAWSDWFEIDPPDGPGECRIVNMLTICWRSATIGQKPTSSGEAWNFEGPEFDFGDKVRSTNIPLI